MCAEIGRLPNESQLAVFAWIRSALAVCRSDPGRFPFVPGRSGPGLVSCAMQLEKFIKGCPGFSSVLKTPFCQDDGLFPADQHPQLVPHRDLDASRLRLSGEGKWSMERSAELLVVAFSRTCVPASWVFLGGCMCS